MTKEITYDHRGFTIYGEFVDTYSNTITIKKSSTAFADRIWVFVDNDPKVLKNPGSAHLNKEQVLELIDALQLAVEEMIYDSEWEEVE